LLIGNYEPDSIKAVAQILERVLWGGAIATGAFQMVCIAMDGYELVAMGQYFHMVVFEGDESDGGFHDL
jgi:hypothetical protein